MAQDSEIYSQKQDFLFNVIKTKTFRNCLLLEKTTPYVEILQADMLAMLLVNLIH